MGRSSRMGVDSLIDQVMHKSWLRRTSYALVLLGAIYFLVNAWQSWHDFRGADTQAAQRLDVQAGLIARNVEDQVRALQSMTRAIGREIETDTLTDASLDDLSGAFRGPLGHTLVGVFNPSDGHLLASSRPEIISTVSLLDPFLAKVRANPSKALLIPVPWGERGAVVAVNGHLNGALKLDAIIVLIVSLEDPLFEEVNFAPGTVLLLRDSEDRVIVRNPLPPQLTTGQVLVDEGAARPGPTTTTQYVDSRFDGFYRLVSTRKVAVGLKPEHWTLSVSYSVSSFRESALASLYFNVAATAIMLVLLASGMWLIRRQNEFASTVATIVENMPTPVAVLDPAADKILLANEALLADFGASADVGQSFAQLFVDAATWPEVRTAATDEAIPMFTRNRTRHMLVRCTKLEFPAKGAASGALLVTLVDITHQQQRLKELRTEADFDALTGLANRRFFERAANKAVAHAQQHGSPLSVLALDLDFFKRVNDTHGHAVGDPVLQVVSRLFEGALRDTDLAARLGGEEFAAILLDTPPDQAMEVAERIRTMVQNTPMILEDGQTLSQTVSIGIAAYCEGDIDLAATHQRADAALYRAKREGRNRVHTYVSEIPPTEESGRG